MQKTVVSGVQATGSLHLGNYLGSIMHWIKMQDEYESFFFLADLHAITIDRSPEELRSSILKTVAIYLASGLDPKKSIIFAQSSVKQHTELSWILNCLAPISWLRRMTQFKDKSGKDQGAVNLGLLSYPVLMAADILLYQADLVPVGDDQKQHLEFTRDLAGIVNRKFNEDVFKIPEALIQGQCTRIMSLKNGRSKMSKSDSSDLSRINLSDGADIIHQKIKKAKTDNIENLTYDPDNRPEISNLLNIYSTISQTKIEDIVLQYQGIGFAKFKESLADLVISTLEPINDRYKYLMKNHDHLLSVLKDGGDRARAKAEKTIVSVKELFGFINL
jgi:tryptophanyl-tRNA synthetase